MFKKLWHKIAVIVRWIEILVVRTTKFLTVEIWELDTEDFSRWKANRLRDIKTVSLMLNTFSAQKIGFQATALSFQSLMSVVPFIALAFYLTGGLGLSSKFEAFLNSNISDERLIHILENAAQNIVDASQAGLFGMISFIAFIWIVVWMMICVVRVFDNVWMVRKPRNFFKQMGIVIGILIAAPFVIIIFFSGSILYSKVLDLVAPQGIPIFDNIRSFLGWLVSGAITVVVISGMYKYIPACKVRYRHAFKAALIAGIVFTVLQYLYLETQMFVNRMNAIYGTVAFIPLFMVWLNTGWTVILYGAELSYAFQNVERYHVSNSAMDEVREAVRLEGKRYTNMAEVMDKADKR